MSTEQSYYSDFISATRRPCPVFQHLVRLSTLPAGSLLLEVGRGVRRLRHSYDDLMTIGCYALANHTLTGRRNLCSHRKVLIPATCLTCSGCGARGMAAAHRCGGLPWKNRAATTSRALKTQPQCLSSCKAKWASVTKKRLNMENTRNRPNGRGVAGLKGVTS